jgi:hypothetical protein
MWRWSAEYNTGEIVGGSYDRQGNAPIIIEWSNSDELLVSIHSSNPPVLNQRLLMPWQPLSNHDGKLAGHSWQHSPAVPGIQRAYKTLLAHRHFSQRRLFLLQPARLIRINATACLASLPLGSALAETSQMRAETPTRY